MSANDRPTEDLPWDRAAAEARLQIFLKDERVLRCLEALARFTATTGERIRIEDEGGGIEPKVTSGNTAVELGDRTCLVRSEEGARQWRTKEVAEVMLTLAHAEYKDAFPGLKSLPPLTTMRRALCYMDMDGFFAVAFQTWAFSAKDNGLTVDTQTARIAGSGRVVATPVSTPRIRLPSHRRRL